MISDFSAGDSVDELFAVKEPRVRKAKNNSLYLQVILVDKTGEVSARWWDFSEDKSKAVPDNGYCRIKGRVESYQGKMNIIIDGAKSVSSSKLDPADFIKVSKYDLDELESGFNELIDSVEDKDLKGLLKAVFSEKKLWDKFRKHPGGKVIHHAFMGGLLEHTLTLARNADRISKDDPRLRRDLLVTGAILHDLGKIYEIQGGVSPSMTDAGCLLGHIYMGASRVDKVMTGIKSFPKGLRMHVLHMILSHHGKKENGSPVTPATPEAFALHHLDNMDARVEIATEAIENDLNPDSKFTERLFVLDHTAVYKE